MLPALLQNEVRDCPGGPAVFSGQCCLTDFSCVPPLPNLRYLFLRQPGSRMFFAANRVLPHPVRANNPLRSRIRHVAGMGVFKQVVDPNARRVIALVADFVNQWKRAGCQQPRYSMGVCRSRFVTTQTDSSIALLALAGRPYPAWSQFGTMGRSRAVFIDLCPKPDSQRLFGDAPIVAGRRTKSVRIAWPTSKRLSAAFTEILQLHQKRLSSGVIPRSIAVLAGISTVSRFRVRGQVSYV